MNMNTDKVRSLIGIVALALTLQQTPRQIADQIKALVEQLVPPATPPPVAAAINDVAAFDAAMAAAAPGAVLELAPTFVYPKPLTLATSITIRSATPGTGRILLTDPAPSFTGGIVITGNAVTLVGLEVRHPDPQHTIVDITGDHVTLERVRVLGDITNGGRHGIAGNGADLKVLRSYVEDCFRTYPGDDSQAFIAWNSPGPFLLEDNYFSGASETVMFGGADAVDEAHVPSNIVIRGNTITKRPEWQAQKVGVKNSLELKDAKTVLIENNEINYSWGGHGQDGYALMLTVRNQDGRAPWSTVSDVTIQNNRIAHAAAAINILGLDNIKETGAGRAVAVGQARPSVRMARVTIRGNTFTDVDPTKYTGSQKMIQIDGGPTDLTIDGNTFAGQNMTSTIYFAGLPMLERFTLTKNTWPKTKYGLFGSGATVGQAWAKFVTSGTQSGNTEKP